MLTATIINHERKQQVNFITGCYVIASVIIASAVLVIAIM